GDRSGNAFCGLGRRERTWSVQIRELRAPGATSSVTTVKLFSQAVPNDVVIATSAASRPVAISTRPIRGTLLRASKVHQRSSRHAWYQALKSIGVVRG